MTIAYVLISCDLGFDAEIVDEIKQVKDVKEVRGVFGAYDILVKLELANAENLKDIITWKIRKLNRVRSTLTLMVTKD
ncbi:MAG: Lrp/AsnC ligand binding domain-containing protein [Thaumarchaeota archaeon]|nr:Lrp/AsnC ligand binding domain-containing protein [Nitrososphaerota archaeon]